jgi:serpin B
MTWAGAEGETRREMTSVLHYPAGDNETHASLAELTKELSRIVAETETSAASQGGEPITLLSANRLFGQSGYPFREAFISFIKQQYDAPLELVDFKHNPEHARSGINAWVETETRQKIRDLIPPRALDSLTRLVLVNAIYLKAPWLHQFSAKATKRLGFHLANGTLIGVPTMRQEDDLGYVKRSEYTAVTIPYVGGGLQLLILLPDRADGLRELERKLTPEMLATEATAAVPTDVMLELPKFKIEPPVMSLGDVLQTLGMKAAFDIPPRSANFDRMAPRSGDDYLFIKAVFHKTFLGIDEKGTEAAAATAVVMELTESAHHPIEVRVDRPFILAVQEKATGACLFLGRVTDPRAR